MADLFPCLCYAPYHLIDGDQSTGQGLFSTLRSGIVTAGVILAVSDAGAHAAELARVTAIYFKQRPPFMRQKRAGPITPFYEGHTGRLWPAG